MQVQARLCLAATLPSLPGPLAWGAAQFSKVMEGCFESNRGASCLKRLRTTNLRSLQCWLSSLVMELLPDKRKTMA